MKRELSMIEYAMTAQSVQRGERIAELERALSIVIEACEGLAEQQAMPDDSWIPKIENARSILARKRK